MVQAKRLAVECALGRCSQGKHGLCRGSL